MPRAIAMRPHHFLCLPGYKGVSYNKTHANSWDILSRTFLRNPDTIIKITMTEDTLCKKCPHGTENSGVCDKNFVEQIDNKIKSLLNLEEGKTYKYSEIAVKLFELLNPVLHAKICSGCGWRKQGLCQDTFKKIEVRFLA